MKLQVKLMVLSVVLIWLAIWFLPDGKLHVVFCDVGQGDATLITYKSFQILVDAGPENSISRCLAKYMPFYDKKIDVVILTHDNTDHSQGMEEVAKRYKVTYWQPKLRQGQVLKMGDIRYAVEWPDSQVLGANTISTENELGIVGKVSYKEFDVLLTADVSTKNYAAEAGLEIFKVPHHGSKTGVTAEWLVDARPKLAVISVGRNSFGHPAKEAIELLSHQGIEILRTDEQGDIEIISDGTRFWVK